MSIPGIAFAAGLDTGRAGARRGTGLGVGFAFGTGFVGIFIPGIPGIDCAIAGTGSTAAPNISNARII